MDVVKYCMNQETEDVTETERLNLNDARKQLEKLRKPKSTSPNKQKTDSSANRARLLRG